MAKPVLVQNGPSLDLPGERPLLRTTGLRG